MMPLFIACLLMLQLVCCCSVPATTGPSDFTGKRHDSTPQQIGEPSVADDLIASGFFNGTPAGEKEAWDLFTKNGQYRAARANDFQLPEAAKRVPGIDLDKATSHPYIGGDINHDNDYSDFAVIVVATQRTDAARFGLVIFTQAANRKAHYEPHWLYRERDLSSTVLEWWSGGLAVREYREDGTDQYCYVNWDQQARAVSCDKNFAK